MEKVPATIFANGSEWLTCPMKMVAGTFSN
jgi:hypothetical protein